MHPMTKDEFQQYRLLVQRKGKAMTIPAELRLGKYGAEYQKIVTALRTQFQPYLAYYITAGKNNLRHDAETAERVRQQKAIFAGIQTALYDGDLKKMDRYCDRLKEVYRHEG